MSWVEGNLAGDLWTYSRRLGALGALLLLAWAVAAVALSAETRPVKRGEVKTLTAAQPALPCRHQMMLSERGPACSAAPSADITAEDVGLRKPHGLGGRPSTRPTNCLRLPKRGWVCAPTASGSGRDG